MTLFFIGLIIFFGVHLVPSLPALRTRTIETVGGLKTYRLFFALIALLGVVLIVLGYKQSPPVVVKEEPSAWAKSMLPFVMPFAFILFVSARIPTHWRNTLRHPQLLGVFLWSFFHYFANNTATQVWLFGLFVIFSVVGIISAELRGYKPKPVVATVATDMMAVVVGLAAYFILAFSHKWLFGVAAIQHHA